MIRRLRGIDAVETHSARRKNRRSCSLERLTAVFGPRPLLGSGRADGPLANLDMGSIAVHSFSRSRTKFRDRLGLADGRRGQKW